MLFYSFFKVFYGYFESENIFYKYFLNCFGEFMRIWEIFIIIFFNVLKYLEEVNILRKVC